MYPTQKMGRLNESVSPVLSLASFSMSTSLLVTKIFLKCDLVSFPQLVTMYFTA